MVPHIVKIKGMDLISALPAIQQSGQNLQMCVIHTERIINPDWMSSKTQGCSFGMPPVNDTRPNTALFQNLHLFSPLSVSGILELIIVKYIAIMENNRQGAADSKQEEAKLSAVTRTTSCNARVLAFSDSSAIIHFSYQII